MSKIKITKNKVMNIALYFFFSYLNVLVKKCPTVILLPFIKDISFVSE